MMITIIGFNFVELNHAPDPVSSLLQQAKEIWQLHIEVSRISCQKGPTRHAYASQIGPFWQDTLNMRMSSSPIMCFLQNTRYSEVFTEYLIAMQPIYTWP